jgi:hypothetical protein
MVECDRKNALTATNLVDTDRPEIHRLRSDIAPAGLGVFTPPGQKLPSLIHVDRAGVVTALEFGSWRERRIGTFPTGSEGARVVGVEIGKGLNGHTLIVAMRSDRALLAMDATDGRLVADECYIQADIKGLALAQASVLAVTDRGLVCLRLPVS